VQALTKYPNRTLFFIIILAIILRLISLADHSLWYDEAFSVLFAEAGFDAMLAGTTTPSPEGATEIHPLFYYITLNGWMAIVGQSLFAIRVFNVLLAGATIFVIYHLMSAIFDKRTGLITALVVALMPFHIHYSQEVRMYSLLSLLLMSNTLAFWKAWHSESRAKWGYWVLFGITAALAMYTQQLAAFYLMAIGLVPFIARRPQQIIGVSFGALVALILYAPWFSQIAVQLQAINANYWIEQPTPDQLIITLYLFFTTYAEIVQPLGIIALMTSMIFLAMMSVQLLMDMRHPRREAKAMRRRVGFIAWLEFFPIIAMWTVSQVQPVYIERGLIASALMLYCLVGWFFANSNMKRIIKGVLALLLATPIFIGLYTQYTLQNFPYSPIEPMMADIRAELEPDESYVVVHFNKLSALPARYHARDLNHQFIADPIGATNDTLSIPVQETFDFFASQCLQEAVDDADTVHFIVYERSEREFANVPESLLAENFAWLETSFEFIEKHTYNDINRYMYHRLKETSSDCETP